MKHYVYRISNVTNNRHYYGARSASNPAKDIGVTYFSSSTDKKFVQDQKINPQNYKYKVVSIYLTRKEAIAKEVRLHTYFNVGVSIHFYNKAKQTSTKFDTTGISPVISDSQKAAISKAHKGKVLSTTTRSKISQNHHDVSGENNPMFGSKGAMAGKILVVNLLTGIRGIMFKEEFTSRSNNIVSVSSTTKRTPTVRICSHCGKSGSGGNMARYHFDNCKISK
jgi:hypothetical protein